VLVIVPAFFFLFYAKAVATWNSKQWPVASISLLRRWELSRLNIMLGRIVAAIIIVIACLLSFLCGGPRFQTETPSIICLGLSMAMSQLATGSVTTPNSSRSNAMSDTDKVFAGSIPEIYDTYLVPLIFEGYAADLARRSASANPRTCWKQRPAPAVSRERSLLFCKKNARYIVSDLNQPMLGRAARRQARTSALLGSRRMPLACRSRTTASMPFAANLARCSFQNRIAGYLEARRVLKAGGCFHFNVWIASNGTTSHVL